MAMVLFCMVKQLWAYVEGWRDSRREWRRAQPADETEEKEKKRKIKRMTTVKKGKRRGEVKMVVRGKYMLNLR